MMHILTANISSMVRDSSNITIAIKYKVTFGLQINSIRLFGQTYTYNGLIKQKCIYRIEVTNAYNVL